MSFIEKSIVSLEKWFSIKSIAHFHFENNCWGKMYDFMASPIKINISSNLEFIQPEFRIQNSLKMWIKIFQYFCLFLNYLLNHPEKHFHVHGRHYNKFSVIELRKVILERFTLNSDYCPRVLIPTNSQTQW